MRLIWEIRDSIYGPEYYQGLIARPFSYSLKYFLTLAVLVAFIVSVTFLTYIVPVLQSFLTNVGTKVLEYYPSELQITIKNGIASSNVQEPYFVKFPPEFKDSMVENKNVPDDLENLFVIDTKTTPTIDQFKNYKTLLLLTKDSVVNYDNGKITIQPLDKISDFTLDKTKISSFLDKAQPYFKFIYPIVAIISFFVFFIGIDANLFYLLFAALLVWLIARVKKINVGYKKSYQLGLHLITGAMLLDNLLFLVVPRAHIPYLFTATIVILAVVNLKPGASQPAPPPQA